MGRKFVCHEEPGHVEEVHITIDDLIASMNFYDHFGIEWDLLPQMEEAFCTQTQEDLHNAAHLLLEVLIAAEADGHPMCQDPMFVPIMKELKLKQAKCARE